MIEIRPQPLRSQDLVQTPNACEGTEKLERLLNPKSEEE